MQKGKNDSKWMHQQLLHMAEGGWGREIVVFSPLDRDLTMGTMHEAGIYDQQWWAPLNIFPCPQLQLRNLKEPLPPLQICIANLHIRNQNFFQVSATFQRNFAPHLHICMSMIAIFPAVLNFFKMCCSATAYPHLRN